MKMITVLTTLLFSSWGWACATPPIYTVEQINRFIAEADFAFIGDAERVDAAGAQRGIFDAIDEGVPSLELDYGVQTVTYSHIKSLKGNAPATLPNKVLDGLCSFGVEPKAASRYFVYVLSDERESNKLWATPISLQYLSKDALQLLRNQ